MATADRGASLGAKLDTLELSDAEQALLHGRLADAADLEVAGFTRGFSGMLTGMSFGGLDKTRPRARPTSTNLIGDDMGIVT